MDMKNNNVETITGAASRTVIVLNPEAAHEITAEVLEKPYTVEELKERMDGNGYVSGNVVIALGEIVSCDFEQFLDLCAIRLADNECLMDVTYDAVGIRGAGTGDAGIVISVRGDVSEIVRDSDDDDDGDDGDDDNNDDGGDDAENE